MFDFGTEFAAGDEAAGAIVEVDVAGGHGPDFLGGDEDDFDAEGTDVTHFSGAEFLKPGRGISVADEFVGLDFAGLDGGKGLLVQMCAVAVGGGEKVVEIGEDGDAEAEFPGVEEPDGDAPEWLAKGEVAGAIDGVEEPLSGFGRVGVTELFAPESGAGGEGEQVFAKDCFDFLVDVGDDGAIGLDHHFELASSLLGEFSGFDDVAGGFLEEARPVVHRVHYGGVGTVGAGS